MTKKEQAGLLIAVGVGIICFAVVWMAGIKGLVLMVGIGCFMRGLHLANQAKEEEKPVFFYANKEKG